GRSLAELWEEIPLHGKVELMRDVARAVHAAHRTGLVHRDLKPGNILLARNDSGAIHPYVVDFGLAQEQSETSPTRTGLVSGTPAYISPEQAQGKALDPRTDVYSLGVVLYEILAGLQPFTGSNLAQILVRIVQEDPPPLARADPSIPRDLQTIVSRCLEKEPERRYDSARALAEDLDRFLDGEPILARPAGWLYRAGKKIRKNRAVAAVSAAAAVALLIQGGASLRAQWEARERAELAQRFGQRVGSLESSLRYEVLLPRHDMTPHKRRLRRELESIRAEMERLGHVAEGPGNYALGKIHLALRQVEPAREHLQEAWNAGERGPEVAEMLGRALGLSYERWLAEAIRAQIPGEKLASREEIERTYRRPALGHLKEAARSGRRAPYLSALIAFYEKRYPEAVAHAHESYARAPELYEAAQLEAEVYSTQGDDAADAGQYEEALRLYKQAEEIYRGLRLRAPSDASLYTRGCDLAARRLSVTVAGERPSPAEVDAALGLCGQALEIDSELAEAFTVQSAIHWREGERQLGRGEDPTVRLEAAIRLAGRAVALNPTEGEALSNLAISWRLLADWRRARGLDEVPALEQGLAAARRAVEVDPLWVRRHETLGSAYVAMATSQQRRGLDPSKMLESAAASYNQALAINPRTFPANANLGNVWNRIAELEVSRGQDPSKSVGRAVAALERAARLNPRSARMLNSLGNAHLTLGDYQLARGSDPRAALERAAASYRRALAVNPNYANAHYNLGFTQRSLAQALLEQGQDPEPAFAASRASLDEALRSNPADADVYLEKARVDLLAARNATRQGKSPEKLLGETAIALSRAEELNPAHPDVFFTEAQAERYRVEWSLANRRPSPGLSETVRRGIARIDKALAINSGEARYRAERGALLHLEARLETDPARRREAATRAAAELERAINANPLLAREYGAFLRDARVEAGVTAPRPAGV
ncbi:MAG TPA: tetratricopeptide repeat protein, partial [Thermoanaerobaculia bacterium]